MACYLGNSRQGRSYILGFCNRRDKTSKGIKTGGKDNAGSAGCVVVFFLNRKQSHDLPDTYSDVHN